MLGQGFITKHSVAVRVARWSGERELYIRNVLDAAVAVGERQERQP